MRLRMSSASSAFESASVWFWHTRQRSSEASAITRLSRLSSLASAHALPEINRSGRSSERTSAADLLTLQLADEGYYALVHDLRRHGADLLVADDALLVDHVRFRHSVDAVVEADGALHVVERGGEGIAVLCKPAQAVFALVLVVEAVERREPRPGELDEQPVLVAAGDAPRGPDIEHPDLSERVPGSEHLVGLREERKLERGRGLSHERRGNFARVEREPHREHADQHREHADDGPGLAIHAMASRERSFAAASARRPTGWRRSPPARTPPSAMSRHPPQIQTTKGFYSTRITPAPPPPGSATYTYRSLVRPVSMAASVIG